MITTWAEAEQFAAEHMKSLGFDDADTTNPGADGGVDVRASRAVAQVKHFADSPVGSPAVQQLAGARGRDQVGVFYALSGFTKAALQEAESRSLALFVYSVTGEVSPVSSRAEQLLDEGFFVWSPPPLTGSTKAIFDVMDREAQQIVNVGGRIYGPLADGLAEATDHMDDLEKAIFSKKLGRAAMSTRETVVRWQDPRDIRDFLQDLMKVASINRWLAESVGLDYDEIESQVRGEG